MNPPAESWRPRADVATLRRRAMALAAARSFFAARDVLECETPVVLSRPVSDPRLQNVRCELGVRPASQFFLHTSPEYHMKRLLAAGCPDVYQICRAFRDGESGARHLAEFTLVEWYRRGMSFDGMITETCDFVAHIAGVWERPVAAPLRRSYREWFLEAIALDPLVAELGEIRERAAALLPGGVTRPLRESLGEDRGAWLDLLVVGVLEPHLSARGLVVVDRYPAAQAALARLDSGDPRVAERFEVYLDGIELANGYHELADAGEQRRRFESDRLERARLGLPDAPPDEQLLAALGAGLPDCCGVALGFDRLLMACAGSASIEQVVAFPTPEEP